MLFVEYPKCGTCQKAKKYLNENNIAYLGRNIKDDKPSYDELKEWYNKSGIEIKKLFNTSGLLYKEMNLKDKIKTMSEEECLHLLATDGMLVKRPVIVKDDLVLFGFKEEEYAKLKG